MWVLETSTLIEKDIIARFKPFSYLEVVRCYLNEQSDTTGFNW